MNLQELRNLLSSINSTDQMQMQRAHESLVNFISTPQSIFLIFQLIEEKEESDFILMTSIMLIRQYMHINYYELSPELQNQILDKLFFFISKFKEIKMISMLVNIICLYIKGNNDKIILLLEIIQSLFAQNENIYELLSTVILIIGKNSPILLDKKEKFFNYSLMGLKSNIPNDVVGSTHLYFILKQKGLTTANEPHLDLIIANIQEIGINELYSIVPILNDNITKIPADKLSELYNIFLCSFDEQEYQIELLVFIFNSIQYLDHIQISQLFDLLGQLEILDNLSKAKKCIESLSLYLQKNPEENIYERLKQTIDHLSYEINSQLIGILIYSIVFKVCWSEFYSEIDSFIEYIHSAFDKHDRMIDTSICYILIDLQQIFQKDDIIATEFLKDILGFIFSDDFGVIKLGDLSIILLELFADSMTIQFNELFEFFTPLNATNFPIQFKRFIPILAESLEKSKNVDLSTLRSIAVGANNNSSFAPLAFILMKRSKEFVDIFLPRLLQVLNIQSKTQRIDNIKFVNLVYDYFGCVFDQRIQPIVHKCQEMISSCKEEEFKNTDFLYHCSVFAKNTGDKQLAVRIENNCINFLLNYDEKQKDDIDDYDEIKDDDDDDKGFGDDDFDDFVGDVVNANNIDGVFNSCIQILKLLDKKELRKMLFHVSLFIINSSNLEAIERPLRVMKKLLHDSSDDEKNLYLKKCNAILDKLIKGSLKALNGHDILSSRVDMKLVSTVGFLISESVRYESPSNESNYNFIQKVLKTCQNFPYYSAYVGALYDAFESRSCSPKFVKEIIELMPKIIHEPKLKTVKQSIAFAFVSMCQYDRDTLQCLKQFIPILQSWYIDEKKNKGASGDFLSTIALAFLAFLANGMEMDKALLNEALSEFPSEHHKNTSLMIQSIVKIFSSNEFELPVIQNVALALSRLLLLDDCDLKKRKISSESVDLARNLLISFSKSNPEIIEDLFKDFEDEEKIAKLKDVLIQK